MPSCPRNRDRDVVLRHRLRREHGEEDAEGKPERGADQGRDDAFMADRPPRLAARHPARPQHPELPGWLEASALVDGIDVAACLLARRHVRTLVPRARSAW